MNKINLTNLVEYLLLILPILIGLSIMINTNTAYGANYWLGFQTEAKDIFGITLVTDGSKYQWDEVDGHINPMYKPEHWNWAAPGCWFDSDTGIQFVKGSPDEYIWYHYSDAQNWLGQHVKQEWYIYIWSTYGRNQGHSNTLSLSYTIDWEGSWDRAIDLILWVLEYINL
ncbi:MAG: hypothetical protein ACP5GU_03160 [Thermoprotei archaeon]